jgi:hypothetical protein
MSAPLTGATAPAVLVNVASPIAKPPEVVVPLTLSLDCGSDTPIPTFCAWSAVEHKMATSTLMPPLIIWIIFHRLCARYGPPNLLRQWSRRLGGRNHGERRLSHKRRGKIADEEFSKLGKIQGLSPSRTSNASGSRVIQMSRLC